MFGRNQFFAILSAANGIDHLADKLGHDRLGDMLKFAFPSGHVYAAHGVYEGKPERSWLVLVPNEPGLRQDAFNVIDAFAKAFQQDSWLEGHTDSCCYLNYSDSVEAIGYWAETGAPEGDYTEIDGRFFQCVARDLRKQA